MHTHPHTPPIVKYWNILQRKVYIHRALFPQWATKDLETEKCKQLPSSKECLGKQSFPFWGAGGFTEEAQRQSFPVWD